MPDHIPLHRGRIAMVPTPGSGKNSANDDLLALRAWGASVLLSLVEHHELTTLGLTYLETHAAQAGLKWHHLPIPDMSAPSAPWLTNWYALSPQLHQLLQEGQSIAIHCRAGRGRTGLVAALLLRESGHSAAQAMATIRSARPGTIETEEQERFLTQYQPSP